MAIEAVDITPSAEPVAVPQETENAQEPEAENEEKKEAEPESELSTKDDSHSKEGLLDTMATTATTLATLVTEVAEEETKFVLLDRLFKFLEQNGELNPVLSGYFCKLVSLLISRKQKQLVPYIFSSESKIIDNLVKHVQQKSISEILNKLVT